MLNLCLWFSGSVAAAINAPSWKSFVPLSPADPQAGGRCTASWLHWRPFWELNHKCCISLLSLRVCVWAIWAGHVWEVRGFQDEAYQQFGLAFRESRESAAERAWDPGNPGNIWPPFYTCHDVGGAASCSANNRSSPANSLCIPLPQFRKNPPAIMLPSSLAPITRIPLARGEMWSIWIFHLLARPVGHGPSTRGSCLAQTGLVKAKKRWKLILWGS